MKKRIVIISAILVISAALSLYLIQLPRRNLILLFTHDLHSNLDEYNLPAGGDKVISAGGYARLAGAIEKERRGRKNYTLTADAGDYSMGTLFHTIRSDYSAELVTMGAMGYDVTTFGNHDFEFGPAELASSLLAAKNNSTGRLPLIVASNTIVDPKIKELDSLRMAFAEYPVMPYQIITRAGKKIGIFGLMGKDAATYVPEAAPVVFSDYIEAAEKTVDILRNKEKVDMVICLSHCGTWRNKDISEDEILARSVSGIDVIISGHTHTVLDRYIRAGNTYIVSCGAYGRYLGRLEIAGKSGAGFKAVSYRLIPITAGIPEDPKLSGLIAIFRKEAQKKYLNLFGYRYGQSIAEAGFSLRDFNWEQNERAKMVNSGLGDLVTDSFRYAVKKIEGDDYREISLVFEGFGQIRAPLTKGAVSVNDAFRVLALGKGEDGLSGYSLVTCWLTGKEIKSLLEIEATLAPAGNNMRLQVTGMRFSYDPKAPAFARVKTVEVETNDGKLQPLEDNRLYRACTNWKTFLMRANLEALSGGKIKVVPKDESGKPIADLRTARVIFDKNNSIELKEWPALAMYLESFPAAKDNGLPQIPAHYRRPRTGIAISE